MHRWSCLVLFSFCLVGLCPHTFAQLHHPAENWQQVEPPEVGLNAQALKTASARALEAGGSGMITRHGLLAHSWGDLTKRYDLKSTSKSIGVTALGLALADKKLRLEDKAAEFHPLFGVPPDGNTKHGWHAEITIQHLATQTAGFAKPGGYQPLLFRPGTAWHYSDGGPNWLAECVTYVYQRDVESLLFERVFDDIGILPEDLRWRDNQYRDHKFQGVKRCEFGSGVHANVDAMARLGLLYLRRGAWQGKQLIPSDFVDIATGPDPHVAGLGVFVPQGEQARFGEASKHYGLLWWNNADGTLKNIPRDAYWSWGLHDSLILVIPSLDIVASRTGKSWNREPDMGHYEVLAPFFEAIVSAVDSEDQANNANRGNAPYPASDAIRNVQWQPANQILRLADGSDNWPITWADDGWMYTAYGDGWGFEPKVEKKLSLGLARVNGVPYENKQMRCENLRSATAEQIGQGPNGKKASGMLSVDGVLYMLVRNADNSQLAWSTDYGKNWSWCEWRFETSFGCPTFLNAGKDYADAPDNYAYVFSLDGPSAYEPADQMVLARVPSDKILEHSAYKYFAGLKNDRKTPIWSKSIDDRRAIFHHASRCYRGGVTYSPTLRRFLWCQTIPESLDRRGPRFEGGFGIYESQNPWGPWRTVFFTEHWDVGPGETSCLPSKWIRPDGTGAFLLFSGDDHFSVRKLSFEASRP